MKKKITNYILTNLSKKPTVQHALACIFCLFCTAILTISLAQRATKGDKVLMITYPQGHYQVDYEIAEKLKTEGFDVTIAVYPIDPSAPTPEALYRFAPNAQPKMQPNPPTLGPNGPILKPDTTFPQINMANYDVFIVCFAYLHLADPRIIEHILATKKPAIINSWGATSALNNYLRQTGRPPVPLTRRNIHPTREYAFTQCTENLFFYQVDKDHKNAEGLDIPIEKQEGQSNSIAIQSSKWLKETPTVLPKKKRIAIQPYFRHYTWWELEIFEALKNAGHDPVFIHALKQEEAQIKMIKGDKLPIDNYDTNLEFDESAPIITTIPADRDDFDGIIDFKLSRPNWSISRNKPGVFRNPNRLSTIISKLPNKETYDNPGPINEPLDKSSPTIRQYPDYPHVLLYCTGARTLHEKKEARMKVLSRSQQERFVREELIPAILHLFE